MNIPRGRRLRIHLHEPWYLQMCPQQTSQRDRLVFVLHPGVSSQPPNPFSFSKWSQAFCSEIQAQTQGNFLVLTISPGKELFMWRAASLCFFWTWLLPAPLNNPTVGQTVSICFVPLSRPLIILQSSISMWQVSILLENSSSHLRACWELHHPGISGPSHFLSLSNWFSQLNS